MIVTIFRSHLNPEHAAEYHEWPERMWAPAQTMPGFISIRTFQAEDGERVSLVEFDSEETQRAWHDNLEHRQAQRLGREKLYKELQIQVCSIVRQYSSESTGA